MQRSFNAIVSLFSICWCFLLGCILPQKGKRILFLMSVYARLVEKGLVHGETLNKLNQLLALADNDSALVLPPSIYRRVIDDAQLKEAIAGIESSHEADFCLTYDEARRVSHQLVALTPNWLKYGDQRSMEHDCVSLFYCHTA